VLDEIFAGGDAAFMERATRMYQMIDQANIMIMVSHDHRLVSALCNRVIWMDHGRLIRDGAPDEIIAEYLGRSAHA
jgi:ABC-type polysaccharide/polyol phosphate transport system ATPase subunit